MLMLLYCHKKNFVYLNNVVLVVIGCININQNKIKTVNTGIQKLKTVLPTYSEEENWKSG